jgi:hypothetical protein
LLSVSTCAWLQRLKLQYGKLLSSLDFDVSLRPHVAVIFTVMAIFVYMRLLGGRGSHSSTFQLNLTEPFLTQNER